MTDLLHCPFCNGKPDTRLFGNTHYVYCTDCEATTGGTGHTTMEAAEATWNRRVPSQIVVTPGPGPFDVTPGPIYYTQEVDASFYSAEVAAENGWQPIETAPKDGQYFLAWWPYYTDDRPCIARWFMDDWQIDEPYSYETNADLIYWQPLPEPPRR